MEENEQIIVDVQMDALIASLQELRRQYEANAEAIKNLDKKSDTYEKDVIELTQQNKVLRQEMSGVEKQIQNEIKIEKAQEGSLVQLRAQLANLSKQYDSMSGFDRMGTAGQDLQKKIKALSDQIVNLEGNTGRWQRNVGNYKSALEGLKSGFQGAGLATGGLDKSLKLLNANPIMLLLTAIVTAVKAIVKAFKDNEEATMQLKQAFAAFNPIIDAAKRGIETFARVVVNVVTTAVSGLTTAIGWLLDKAQAVGNFFGADWHMGDNFREGVQGAVELQKAENDYINNKRKWSVESAKIDREVADLREKASDKERYNAQQRLDFMDKAIALETQKAAKEKELAEQNLDNLKKEAARTANSAAMNDKLAEAERAVIEADKNLSDTKRSLNKQRQAAIKEINGETDAIVKQTKEIRENISTIKAMTYDEALTDAAKKDKALADSIKEVTDRLGLLDEQFDKLDPHALDEFLKVSDENLKDNTKQWELFAEGFKDNAETITETAAAVGDAFGSLSDIYKTMAKDESKSEAEREKAAKNAKRWSALQIAANSGTALAKGISGAMEAEPWPAKLAALATIMASVLSAVAQAKALAAEGHEHGGVLGGKFVGATSGPDTMVFRGRPGELVLNAQQQRQLYEIANGGNVTGGMTAALAEAISNMPAPVLVYSEFGEFTRQVQMLENNSKLG